MSSEQENKPSELTKVDSNNSEKKEEFPNKIFIGNLPTDQTEEDLVKLFEEYGTIVQTILFTKKTTFSFIAYETLEQAEKAVEASNGKQIGENVIKVELARPKKSFRKFKKNFKPRPKGKKNKDKKEEKESEDETKPVEVKEEKKPEAEEAKEENGKPTSSRGRGRKSRGRGTRGRGRGRGRGHKSIKEVGEPSDTTLFVANLPFSLSDEGLRQVFEQFKVVSAHVVRRSATNHSKGFGFVELVDKEEQAKVIAQIGEVEINGRVLNISIAHSEPYVPPTEEEEANQA